jgi:hypothetical protein
MLRVIREFLRIPDTVFSDQANTKTTDFLEILYFAAMLFTGFY